MSEGQAVSRESSGVEEATLPRETSPAAPVEVSVVMPCLNEADTLQTCIRKAREGLQQCGVSGEIIVADNGSTDGSAEIAERLNCRVVPVRERGYGAALMGGIAAARGTLIIMGDADDSYDFRELPRFVQRLRGGDDLVLGCRLPSGGGRILPGAMPTLHRWLGNPMLSRLAATMFSVPVHDVYCGLRGFRREFYERLDQQCTGMEFATEMVIRTTLAGGRISEVPITLHPDGRTSHPPHLRTFRDGWRTLQLFLLYSPRWAFLIPGTVLILLGLIGYALAMPAFQVFGATLDAHTLLFSSLAMIVGYQAILFALLAKVFAISVRLLPEDPRIQRLLTTATLEKALLGSAGVVLVGLGLLAAAVVQWWSAGFGPLDYAVTMRWVIPGVTLTALGVQTILSAFFLSILRLHRK